METIKCIECGEIFPKDKDACTNCGCPSSFSLEVESKNEIKDKNPTSNLQTIRCIECGEIFPKDKDACTNCGCPSSFSLEVESKNEIKDKNPTSNLSIKNISSESPSISLLNNGQTDKSNEDVAENKQSKKDIEKYQEDMKNLGSEIESLQKQKASQKSNEEIEETNKKEKVFTNQSSKSDPNKEYAHQNSGGIIDSISKIGEAEGLGDFNTIKFFGGVPRKYSEDEFVKNIFVGTERTTPSIKDIPTEYPQPWIFSRLIVVALVVFYAFKFAYDQTPNPIYIPALIITGSFGIPLSTLVLFLELNIRRNIPIWTIGKLFLAGAVLSLFLNQVFFESTLSFLGWAGASAAAVTEEPAKLLALVLLARGKKRYPYILNGLLLGAAVGCGFAAFESAGYAYNNTQYYKVFFNVITIRGILSPFAHIVWTAVAGAALWRVKKGGNFSLKLLKKKAFYAPFGTVTFCHAIWNSPIQLPFNGTQIICGLISWIVALSLLNLGIKQIAQEKSGKEIFNTRI